MKRKNTERLFFPDGFCHSVIVRTRMSNDFNQAFYGDDQCAHPAVEWVDSDNVRYQAKYFSD